jgi:hypothetical protein
MAATDAVVDGDRVEVEGVVEVVERVLVDTVVWLVGVGVLNVLDVAVEMAPFSIYKLSLSGPPQYSKALPVHNILHPFVAGTELV